MENKTIEELAEEKYPVKMVIAATFSDFDINKESRAAFIAGHTTESEDMVSKSEVVRLIKNRMTIVRQHKTTLSNSYYNWIKNELIELITLINNIK